MICFSLWIWLWCAFYNRRLKKHIILLLKMHIKTGWQKNSYVTKVLLLPLVPKEKENHFPTGILQWNLHHMCTGHKEDIMLNWTRATFIYLSFYKDQSRIKICTKLIVKCFIAGLCFNHVNSISTLWFKNKSHAHENSVEHL